MRDENGDSEMVDTFTVRIRVNLILAAPATIHQCSGLIWQQVEVEVEVEVQSIGWTARIRQNQARRGDSLARGFSCILDQSPHLAKVCGIVAILKACGHQRSQVQSAGRSFSAGGAL